jgi:AraC-like DNA-binding protein
MGNNDVPQIPVSYAERFVALLESRGIITDDVLAAGGLTRGQLGDPAGRIPVTAFGDVLARGAELAEDPGLGLELGLQLKASSHGMVGFALITCNTLRDAMALGERFVELRATPWKTQLLEEGETAILRFIEVAPMGRGRTVMLEGVLGAAIRLGEFMLGEPFTHPDIEFWSDGPELPHHARFRDRVPRVRYNCATNEARFPAAWLDRPLALREPVANREVVTVLEHERKLFAGGDDLVDRTRALVSNPANGFPDLNRAAARLRVSSRTLRRHLSRSGTTFQALRDEVRRAYSMTLLERSRLAVDDVARELGYADAAGFVRAFQRWTGETPANYRRRSRAGREASEQ